MSFSEVFTVISLVISVVAVGISIISYRDNKKLALKGFSRNYRPYVFAGNFGYIDANDGLLYTNMNRLMVSIINAPSKILKKKLVFYIRENGKDSVCFEHPDYKGDISYPLDKGQTTIDTDSNTINHNMALELQGQNKQLVRKVRIEYTWISDESEIYYFDGEWIYNIKSHNWDTVRQLAN